MVRRAILDRSAQSTAHDAGAEAAPGAPDPAGGSAERTGPRWRGAGSRWLIWASRAVLWAVLLVIGYRGVTAIVTTPRPAQVSPAVGAGAAHGFPVSLAEAYALQFGQVYLNFSPVTQTQREQELAAFLPPSLAAANPDLGWNGAGSVRLQSEQVASITVQDSQHAVVSLLADVSGQLMELGVPVYAAGSGVVVSGAPAWLPAPQAISPPSPAAMSSDPVAQGELMNQLPAFFQAFANGGSAALRPFLAPGVSLSGLGGSVAFDSIQNLAVPPGGSARDITVTVVWQVLGQDGVTSAKLAMAYRVSVVDFQSGKWYVKGISASTEAVGAQ
jgi:hypothetical protein